MRRPQLARLVQDASWRAREMQSRASMDAIYTACVDRLTKGLVLTITSRQDCGDFAFKTASLPDQSGPFNTGCGLRAGSLDQTGLDGASRTRRAASNSERHFIKADSGEAEPF